MVQQRNGRRSGRGLYPPNPTQWENETRGLNLRRELGLPLDVALPHLRPFDLLPGVSVMDHVDVPMAAVFKDRLRNGYAWSGISLPCEGGGAIVIYNGGHSLERVRATLMEEFFHLRLGHPPTILRIYNGDAIRTYNKKVERQAYESGAAALLPFKHLKAMADAGATALEIARHFEVSEDLVLFRAKLTKQYAKLVE